MSQSPKLTPPMRRDLERLCNAPSGSLPISHTGRKGTLIWGDQFVNATTVQALERHGLARIIDSGHYAEPTPQGRQTHAALQAAP